jgi:hypothetical protein
MVSPAAGYTGQMRGGTPRNSRIPSRNRIEDATINVFAPMTLIQSGTTDRSVNRGIDRTSKRFATAHRLKPG